MKRIFICSPFAGGNKSVKKNLRLAKELCRIAALELHAPFAPHLFCPQFLDDKDTTERELGIAIGLKFLETCDELWYSLKHGMSTGMRAEIDKASELGIKIVEK